MINDCPGSGKPPASQTRYFATCSACGASRRIRADGMIPIHVPPGTPREWSVVNDCAGGGTLVKVALVVSRPRTAHCPSCGRPFVAVNRNGKIRKHPPAPPEIARRYGLLSRLVEGLGDEVTRLEAVESSLDGVSPKVAKPMLEALKNINDDAIMSLDRWEVGEDVDVDEAATLLIGIVETTRQAIALAEEKTT